MGGGSSMPVMQQTSKPQSAAAQADHGRNQVALSAVASPTQEPVSLIQKSRGSPAPTPAWARTEKEEKNVGPAISKSSALYEVTSSPALNWMDKPVDTLIEDALKGSRTRPIRPPASEADHKTKAPLATTEERTLLSGFLRWSAPSAERNATPPQSRGGGINVGKQAESMVAKWTLERRKQVAPAHLLDASPCKMPCSSDADSELGREVLAGTAADECKRKPSSRCVCESAAPSCSQAKSATSLQLPVTSRSPEPEEPGSPRNKMSGVLDETSLQQARAKLKPARQTRAASDQEQPAIHRWAASLRSQSPLQNVLNAKQRSVCH